MHGGGPVLYKKPTSSWVVESPRVRIGNWSISKPKPKEKTEIELFLERIGYVK